MTCNEGVESTAITPAYSAAVVFVNELLDTSTSPEPEMYSTPPSDPDDTSLTVSRSMATLVFAPLTKRPPAKVRAWQFEIDTPVSA